MITLKLLNCNNNYIFGIVPNIIDFDVFVIKVDILCSTFCGKASNFTKSEYYREFF